MSGSSFPAAPSQYPPSSYGSSPSPFGSTAQPPGFSSGFPTTSSSQFGFTPSSPPSPFGTFGATTQPPFASHPFSSVPPNPMFSSVSSSTTSLFGTTRTATTTSQPTTPPASSSPLFGVKSSPSLFGTPSSTTTSSPQPLFGASFPPTPSLFSSFPSTTSSISSLFETATQSPFSTSSSSSTPFDRTTSSTITSTASTSTAEPLFRVPTPTTAAATTSASATAQTSSLVASKIEVESPPACDAEIVADNTPSVIYLGYRTDANQNVVEPGTIIHNVQVAEDSKLPGEREQASSSAVDLRDSLAVEENCQEQNKDPPSPKINEVAEIQRPVALPTQENTTTPIASASSSTIVSSAQLQLKPENTEMARQYLAAVNAIYSSDSTSFSWSSGQSNQVNHKDFEKARHDFLILLGELQMNHLSLDLEERLEEFHSIVDSIGDCGLSMAERSKVSDFLGTTRNYHKSSMAFNSQQQTLQVKIAEKDQNFVAIGLRREEAITQEKDLRKSEEKVAELERALQAAKEVCATAESTFMQTIADLKTCTDLDRTFKLNDPTIELAELEYSAGHRRESFEKAVAEMIDLVKKMQHREQ